SPHAQLLMAWSCPPETLLEPVAEDTCRCSMAKVTGCVPVPVTLMRRKVRFTGLASATRIVLAPALLVGLPEFTNASAVNVATEGQGVESTHSRVVDVCTQPVSGSHVSFVHTLPSVQMGGGPPTQTPLAQVSAVVQALPSLQGSVFGAPPTQAAAPSQVLPLMQGLLAQAWPAGSNWQVGEQQSPATRLPSSHCSPRSTTPLPQM